MTNTELKRANKVSIKMENDLYKAIFYKTHKIVRKIGQEFTDWKPSPDYTKTGNRESFRAYIIEHAESLGILWQPQDMRADNNVRVAKYENNDQLINDAMRIIIPQAKELVEKCKYNIEWCGIEADEIIPMTTTGKGISLTNLGIENGKYTNTGNWAWANISFTITIKYNGQEVYYPVSMQLVSGQLKKFKIGIKNWNEAIKNEIITAGLATEDELDPPKKSTESREGVE